MATTLNTVKLQGRLSCLKAIFVFLEFCTMEPPKKDALRKRSLPAKDTVLDPFPGEPGKEEVHGLVAYSQSEAPVKNGAFCKAIHTVLVQTGHLQRIFFIRGSWILIAVPLINLEFQIQSMVGRPDFTLKITQNSELQQRAKRHIYYSNLKLWTKLYTRPTIICRKWRFF